MHLLLTRSRIVWTRTGRTLDMDIKGSACWSPSPHKLQVTGVMSQLTPALQSWFSAVSIAKSKSSIKRAQILFLYIFQNHRGITVSFDALCFEKWKFVTPRLSRWSVRVYIKRLLTFNFYLRPIFVYFFLYGILTSVVFFVEIVEFRLLANSDSIINIPLF